MKVQCKNDDNQNFQGPISLTNGKYYEVIKQEKGLSALWITVVNDKGFEQQYFIDRFFTQQEEREIKLKKLL
jgi:hypothetical protein